MKTRIRYIWEQLRSTYWFIPTAMVVGAVALAVGSVLLDRALQGAGMERLRMIYPGGPEEARAFLSTIAGSMATVAGVIFSITMVTLSLATSQFGSRLLRNFMRDTPNQVVLGTFIAIFVYAVLVLQTISGVEGRIFVPQISLTIGLLMAVFGLAVLIYFIHHISTSIQAENVIADVGRDLDNAIDRVFPEQREERAAGTEARAGSREPATSEEPGRTIPAATTGYLQAVDQEGLINLAAKRDLVLRLNHRPGDFIVAQSAIAEGWPAEEVDDDVVELVNDAFILGARRLRLQDVEFAINQLVEIAVRALSPGINDPFTAIACIDRLGASLAHLAERDVPPASHPDRQGKVRLVTKVLTFSGVTDAAFNQIRQFGRTSVAVTIRLLETLAVVAAYARSGDQRAAIRRQAEMTWHSANEALPEERDRKDVEERYQLVLRTLKQEQGGVA